MITNDTIAAISTPLGEGGIAVVRISGKNSFSIAHKCYRGKSSFLLSPSHTIHYGKVINPMTSEVIDEALFMLMRKPHTYTGEDTVEINVHGNIKIAMNTLDALIMAGARQANPGEFTQRAFLNGKMDLIQAESVAELISAKTEKSIANANKILEGRLSAKIKTIKDKLVEIIATMELSFDFIEENIEIANNDEIRRKLRDINDKLSDIVATYKRGKFLHSGITVAIVGRTNVGKSSLFNYMVQQEKAIVTDIHGTTRDLIEDYLNINGFFVKIVDTAGFRESNDLIENIGIKKTFDILNKADIVLHIIDASQPLKEEDIKINNDLFDKNVIVVFNKIDLDHDIDKKLFQLKNKSKFVLISAKNETGLEDLNKEIIKSIMDIGDGNDNNVMITSKRQYDLLVKAKNDIDKILENDFVWENWELLVEDFKKVKGYIEEVLGDKVDEDILEHIFQNFCIGK